MSNRGGEVKIARWRLVEKESVSSVWRAEGRTRADAE